MIEDARFEVLHDQCTYAPRDTGIVGRLHCSPNVFTPKTEQTP